MGYKNNLAKKGLADDTYEEDGLALFRIQGTGPENMQAIQVDPVSLVFQFCDVSYKTMPSLVLYD